MHLAAVKWRLVNMPAIDELESAAEAANGKLFAGIKREHDLPARGRARYVRVITGPRTLGDSFRVACAWVPLLVQPKPDNVGEHALLELGNPPPPNPPKVWNCHGIATGDFHHQIASAFVRRIRPAACPGRNCPLSARKQTVVTPGAPGFQLHLVGSSDIVRPRCATGGGGDGHPGRRAISLCACGASLLAETKERQNPTSVE